MIYKIKKKTPLRKGEENYHAFLIEKRKLIQNVGFSPQEVHKILFPFQRDITSGEGKGGGVDKEIQIAIDLNIPIVKTLKELHKIFPINIK